MDKLNALAAKRKDTGIKPEALPTGTQIGREAISADCPCSGPNCVGNCQCNCKK